MTARRLRVDPIACTAHGICAELLPELIDLDEWGYPLVKAPVVPRRLTTDAERAVAACPTLALRLERADGITDLGRGIDGSANNDGRDRDHGRRTEPSA